ncbi:hypothetical protein VUS79_33320, partial [Pseudomonas aeruginosa]|uniref:hypothetical protein n=1 Tax=Pseudomonas aeruginosa TaxID=287 RepID=UPI00300B71CD
RAGRLGQEEVSTGRAEAANRPRIMARLMCVSRAPPAPRDNDMRGETSTAWEVRGAVIAPPVPP